ncbi:hypothetical protein LCGC14_1702600 [marine sediment metagenome]|uniref:Class I SAM-dependent methyltransferase n=1 Tax=marine sediment metagenome TaxID=412755 RepID=A0A0F9HH77_9ZZZZ
MNKPTLLEEMFPRHPYADWLPGSCEPWTVDVICALIRATSPLHILETGTFEAKTTMRMHWASGEESNLTSLECVEEHWEKASAKCLDLPGVTVLHAEAVSYLLNYKGPKFNFVFLDDDHGRDHVAMELDLLYNFTTGKGLMAPGGLICVHDVCGSFDLGAVVVARHGFVLSLPLLHRSGGLGLIQIPVST